MIKPFVIALGLAACITVAAAAPARADSFKLYSGGDNVVVTNGPPSDPNVLQVTSNTNAGNPGYGGMYFDVTSGNLTPASLTTLSALYEMTIGTFGGGAPRFTLFDTTSNPNNAAYIYWGTPQPGGTFTDPHPGSFASTGNLANLSSTDVRVQVNGFGGDSTGASYETWAQFVAKDGGVNIRYVTLDLDGGFTQPNNTQRMITDEFTVNSNVYEAGPDPAAVPEPASFTLLSIGLAVLGGYKLRRRLPRMARQ
jgi:hypothetical protein